MQTLSDTTAQMVDDLMQSSRTPLLSVTPTSVAIADLAARTEALESALREIMRELRGREPTP